MDLHSAFSFRSLMRIRKDTGTRSNPWGILLVTTYQTGIKRRSLPFERLWSKQFSIT